MIDERRLKIGSEMKLPKSTIDNRQSAFIAGEPALQILAVHKLVHHLGDDPPSRFACYGAARGTQIAVTGLIPLIVHRLKSVEMPGEALPEGRCPGLSGTKNLRNHASQCTKGGVLNSGTPLKKL